VCLIFGARMSWWPRHHGFVLTSLGPLDNAKSRSDTYAPIVLGTSSIIFSALAGYYACFWPGDRPVHRLSFGVLLPALAGVCLFFGRFAYLGASYSTILDGGSFARRLRPEQWSSWTASPGFHVVFAGLLLICIFSVRLFRGRSSLPLALRESSVVELPSPELWRRTRFLIWVLIGPLFLAAAVPGIALSIVAIGASIPAAVFQNPYFIKSASMLDAIVNLAIVWWIVGKGGRGVLLNSVQLSGPKYLSFGAAFSIGIALLISATQFVAVWSRWAATEFGKASAPHARAFFGLPSPWLLLMFFAALAEELIFRGFLQAVLIRRYGIYRGVFLTGLVWAGYHFNSDASFGHLDELGVLSRVVFRLGNCIALGFVLSWLTLRAGSVLPAAVTHTIYNILVSDFGLDFHGRAFLWNTSWLVLACLLYRYWPVEAPNALDTETLALGEPGIST
jgi:membrane protease YdiL (CAAX protease family)